MNVWVRPKPHTHTERGVRFPSSVPPFLQVGLLLSPITYKCLLKVLCPVSRPVTTPDCVLLKGSERAFVAKLGPEINFRVLQGPRHLDNRRLSNVTIDMLPEDPKGRISAINCWVEPPRCEFVCDFSSSHPGKSRDPVQPHGVTVAPMGTLFGQPEVLSEPLGYQSKY